MFNFLLDFVFPARCVSCGSFGNFLCQGCQNKINLFVDQVCLYCKKPSPYGFTHPYCQKAFGFDGLYVLGYYRGPLKNLIKAVKYKMVWKCLEDVSKIILTNYHHQFNFDFLVPVPLSKKRERERGFNQAKILATKLQKVLPHSYLADILSRPRNTLPQFSLTREKRLKNVQDAFALKENVIREKMKNQTFCLVDDVTTTGATLFECAKVLKKSGANKVFAITIARGG